MSRWSGPLFIVGTWRSGTSLLYSLLNKHPEVALMYEGDLLMLKPLFWVPGMRKRWAVRWQFWNGAPERHGLDHAKLMEKTRAFYGTAEDIFREYARKKGARIWGDKSPNYFDALHRLARAYPAARFIIIWRDPAAICRSVINAKAVLSGEEPSYFDRPGMVHRALMSCEVLRKQCKWLIEHGFRVHQLHYESLVTHSAREMKRICRFLDISYLNSIACLNGADQGAIYDAGHHLLLRTGRVTGQRADVRPLPYGLQKKIAACLSRWRSASHDESPAVCSIKQSQRIRSSWLHVWDLFLYECLRAFDAMIILAYCSAPIFLLKRFRDLKRRYHRSEFVLLPSERIQQTNLPTRTEKLA
jgi:hypothetical protein